VDLVVERALAECERRPGRVGHFGSAVQARSAGR
jgi:hypothetical protein